MKKLLLIPAVVLAVGLATVVSADETTSTFTYDFNANLNPAPVSGTSPHIFASFYNATTPTDDGGIGDSRDPDSGVASGRAFVATHDMARAPDTYQTFSVFTDPANAQARITRLESIAFDMSTFGMFSPFTVGSWIQVDVLASTDGFASNTNLGFLRITQTAAAEPAPDSLFVDLSGLTQFHDLTNATVDFRMLFTTNLNDNGIEGHVDNVALQLSSVPEPGSMGILGLISLVGLGFRRRK